MIWQLEIAYAAGLLTAWAMWPLGRLYKRVERRNLFRMSFGPREGERKLGWRDLVVYAVVHPWKFCLTVLGMPKWSPFHREPKPRPSIDAAELMPKIRKK